MNTTLLLVRHGETVDNANKIMQGQTQGCLNATGIRQAELLRDALASTPLDAIVASDLQRAIDTASIVAEGRGLAIVTTPLLRERDWGSFTGHYIPDLQHEPWPDDIETLDALQRRARAFLDFIRTTFHGQQVLAVGHGIINKAIQAVYHHKPMEQVERMMNCEVRTLQL